MLRVIYGKAGTGKTARILKEIHTAVNAGKGGSIYIVPEQYSHEAEKELARECGPAASLHAEVLSFTGLARRIESELGGGACRYLDDGGRLLTMAVALDTLAKREDSLRVFRNAAGKPESQKMLANAVNELKSAGITAEKLKEASEKEEGVLHEKLRDMATIMESYDAAAAGCGVEVKDRLLVTAERIRKAEKLSFTDVYIDGFTDFTYGEKEIVRELLRRDCCVTLCLTTDGLNSTSETFAIASATYAELKRFAEEQRKPVEEVPSSENPAAPEKGQDDLSFFSENMFSWVDTVQRTTGRISLFSCGGIDTECELAASEALRLVRETGCRWRDIAIAARGFADYKTMLRTTFEYYGVPLYLADDSDVTSKSLPSLIACVYDISRSRWNCDDVISLMSTGLTGLTVEECDELADYLFKWQLDERAWHRCGSWKQNPDGYQETTTEEQKQRLDRINRSAKKLAAPVMDYLHRDRPCRNCREHAENLAQLLKELRLPQKMAQLAESAEPEKAQELRLLWKVVTDALEQCEAVLGETDMTMQDYGRLFLTMLSRYRISTIPSTLDRVSAGDFDRMRRRNIRHLIVLGASDARLPGNAEESGVFTADEREQLRQYEIRLDAGENELWREFTMIYNCLSLPSESLILSYSHTDGEGNKVLPSFVMKQAERMFGLKIQPFSPSIARLSAERPAMSLALEADLSGTAPTLAAQRYFEAKNPGMLEQQRSAARRLRGSLSPDSVGKLYGRNIKVSASKTDTFFDCRFNYFCRYGLRANPYEPAGFNPPEIGTFMHKIFECTAREVKSLGGFKAVDDAAVSRISDRYMDEYVENELGSLEEKSGRFTYLFNRLRRDVHRILEDVADELRNSEFEPVDFELNFNGDELPKYELTDGNVTMRLTGIADRVDAWEHEGKLYLRIVDYKTGTKEFSFSDIYHGHSMQMILYLMALEANGEKKYGSPVTGAGVTYFPARDDMVSVKAADDAAVEKKRNGTKQRRGMMLDDAFLMDAWDTEEEKRFLPLTRNQQKKYKELISREQYDMLSEHVKGKLLEMSGCLARGSIEANPFYVSSSENACARCDYAGACGFAEGEGGEESRPRRKYTPEAVWNLLRKELGMEEPEGKEGDFNE